MPLIHSILFSWWRITTKPKLGLIFPFVMESNRKEKKKKKKESMVDRLHEKILTGFFFKNLNIRVIAVSRNRSNSV